VAYDLENVNLLPEYGKLCGWALALAHAKSGDPVAIPGYLGNRDNMDEAVVHFAAYAKQTDGKYDALAKAPKDTLIRAAKKWELNWWPLSRDQCGLNQ
jgi:hypothetical protein